MRQENHPRFLNELKALSAHSSVSTDPNHAVTAARSEVLVAELERIGMENTRIVETTGHPLVYADWLHATGKPTVLMYGHYDVQPPDPLDEWHSPPFEPTERDGNLYARRRRRRQGPDVHARQGARIAVRHEWQAAAQRARAV